MYPCLDIDNFRWRGSVKVYLLMVLFLLGKITNCLVTRYTPWSPLKNLKMLLQSPCTYFLFAFQFTSLILNQEQLLKLCLRLIHCLLNNFTVLQIMNHLQLPGLLKLIKVGIIHIFNPVYGRIYHLFAQIHIVH